MNIETRTWDPTGPVRDAGLIGQEVLPDGVTQITPMVDTETVTETLIEWDSVPLDPVTCTEKVPVMLAPMVRVAVPEPVMLVGLMTAPIPLEWVRVSETVPENPLTEVTVIVEVPEAPGAIVRLEGVAEMEKSGTPVPVTVTVIFVD